MTVLICNSIPKNTEPYNSKVSDTVFPNIFFALIGFAISSFFVSLYSEGMETIYICFLANHEAKGEGKLPEELKGFLLQAKSGGKALI